MGWESISTANNYVKEDTHHMIKSLKKLVSSQPYNVYKYAINTPYDPTL
jgi:hypothetical protein